MDTPEVIELGKQTLIVFLKAALPLMLISLAVGLIISLFQALTQIQEMTLTFVPKIVAMLVVMMLALPFMLQSLQDFTQHLFARIDTIETDEGG